MPHLGQSLLSSKCCTIQLLQTGEERTLTLYLIYDDTGAQPIYQLDDILMRSHHIIRLINVSFPLGKKKKKKTFRGGRNLNYHKLSSMWKILTSVEFTIEVSPVQPLVIDP